MAWLRPAEPQGSRHDSGRGGRPPPEGVLRNRGDLEALPLPGRDDRGEQEEGALRRDARGEGDRPPPARGRVDGAPLQRGLRPLRAGGAGRGVHDLPGRARPGVPAPGPQGAEPDLPAQERPRDPQGGDEGGHGRLAARGPVREAGLLRPVPGDRLQLRLAASWRRRGSSTSSSTRTASTRWSWPTLRPRSRTLPGESEITYEELAGGIRDDNRIWAWERAQEARSTKGLLWDHTFELPHKHLEAESPLLDSVQAGKETHKLKVKGSDPWELYDWPGEYAQRFDGINRSGGEQQGELQKIFQDNSRTVEIRMDEQATLAVTARGREQREAPHGRAQADAQAALLQRRRVRPRVRDSPGELRRRLQVRQGRAPGRTRTTSPASRRRCRSGRSGSRPSPSCRGASRRWSSGRRGRRSSPTSTGG